MSRSVALAGALAGLLVLVGCGDSGDGGDGGAAGGCEAASEGSVTVVAEDVEWATGCVEAPAGEALTITVDNRDSGVSHNLHVPDAPGSPKTDLEAGPVEQTLEVPPLDAGEYDYVCDVHPNMVGTLRVVDARPA